MNWYLGLDRSFFWLASRLLNLWVRPIVVPADSGDRLRGRGRRLIYVLEERSLTDLLALQIVCRQLGLPSPSRPFAYGALRERRPVVYLERTRGLAGRVDRSIPQRLSRVVGEVMAHAEDDVDLVPVSVFWGRAPVKERSWFRLMLAEDWAITGRFKRALSTFVNGRKTLVHVGDPEALLGFVEASSPSRTVRRIARLQRAQFRSQRAATIGPDLSHRRTVVAEVLRTRAVRAAVAQEMQARNVTRREALMTARGYAYEIAADYSGRFVAFAAGILGRLWNRLYDGVDVHHAERLAVQGEGAQIVYVPCHRSHMDYLLLSYVIYRQGFVAPHVAAGANLDMPGVGRWLRKGGAFFLRRTFKGNALYPIVFMKYLAVMMARGHAIEYFIEGGRSRTGRLLQPKTGMLSMTVRSFLRDPRRAVQFMPVYFGYERLVEGETYIGELSGRPKEKETVGGLLKTLPALRRKFGRVQVSFGTPVDLGQLLDQVAPAWREQNFAGEELRRAWLGPAVDALALAVMRGINQTAAVSAVNLLAVALLATPRQALPEPDLIRLLDLCRDLLREAPYSSDVSCTALAGEELVRYGEAMGFIERRPHALGDVVRLNEQNAVLMTYFRNNVLHVFAMPSLLACAFLNNTTLGRNDLHRLARRIYPYIAQELFLPWAETALEGVVDNILQALARLKILECSADGQHWWRPATGSVEAVQLSFLAHCTIEIIERYYLTIALLLQAGSGQMSQEALENRCQLTASRMTLLYGFNSPEFFDKTLFGGFLDLLRERAVIRSGPDGRLAFDQVLEDVAADARLVLSEQIRHSILQVTHH